MDEENTFGQSARIHLKRRGGWQFSGPALVEPPPSMQHVDIEGHTYRLVRKCVSRDFVKSTERTEYWYEET